MLFEFSNNTKIEYFLGETLNISSTIIRKMLDTENEVLYIDIVYVSACKGYS
jgi:hypothetical protein